MKVVDLIEKLQKVDQDMDVFVAPLTTVPTFDGGEKIVPDLFKRYPAESLATIKEFVGEGDQVFLISFDENKPHRTDLTAEYPEETVH